MENEEKTNEQEVAAAPEAPVEQQTVESLITRMQVSREQVEPPKFLDDLNFTDEVPGSETESGAPEEPLTDDDEANMDYLNYSEEHKTSAVFLIMTFDRVMGFLAGWVANEPAEGYRKFSNKAAISADYLDVTAALVKKYQMRLNLEMILLFTVTAIYAPTFTMAYQRRKMKAAQQAKTADHGKNKED